MYVLNVDMFRSSKKQLYHFGDDLLVFLIAKVLCYGPGWDQGKPRLGNIEDIPDVHAPVRREISRRGSSSRVVVVVVVVAGSSISSSSSSSSCCCCC